MEGSRARFIQEASAGIVKLFEEDPKAMDAVIHFFYNLDYPSASSSVLHQEEHETNEIKGLNGVNGDQHHDDSQASVKTEEPSSSLDDFLPISVSKSAMKQRKKRARRKSLSNGPVDPSGTVTEVVTLPNCDAVETRQEGAPLVQRLAAVNGSGAHQTPIDGPTAKKEGEIMLHARVYSLAKKLGVESLQALALKKFESGTEEQWVPEDFVKAASEISSVKAGSEIEEGKIRGIVLNVLCDHRELIDKEGMESVIRGMDLGYDLVRQLTKRGLIAI